MKLTIFILFLLCSSRQFETPAFAAEERALMPDVIHFYLGKLTLGGVLYKPDGKGPFPAILYNHGKGAKMINSQTAARIAPYFVKHGWAFFMPYRRGQGLSEDSGSYIGDEIKKAGRSGGAKAASTKTISLLKTEQLDDQLAAYAWLKKQTFIDHKRIAVGGNSFGGIESILAATKEPFCAGFDASGGADSWQSSPELQKLLKKSVRMVKCPIYFFQAENDYDLTPSRALSAEMKSAGKKFELKIYPKQGTTTKEGHAFNTHAVNIWFPDVFAFLDHACHLQSTK